ncbi:hypothetical protein L249_8698 [Ophiocordyceps polyrhachis-furcata BCC 54312]|uniref:BTB domain-containing protein n=1 Tax=Ophiocordyceps polyrhachis-furcata BCC 54312 TaxID=1330021 RepID=A0A367L6G1_9HYPO|nr:hypothetical protein L249_8698 [Ophiocordyceps polyrhachis-furcata BCC 54312]
MATANSNSALSALADLMKSEAFSDLTFTCNEHRFKVHKCVVYGQSPVIKAALSHDFEEGRTNVIPMDAFDPDTVRRLVQFFYTGDYRLTALPELEPPLIGSVDSLNMHIKVNSIGDYYGVTKLMSLANDKIKHLIQQEHKRRDVSAAVSGWVENLPAATELATSSSGDHELLAILAAEIAKNLSALTLSRDFRNLNVVSDLAFKVLEACVKEIQGFTMQINKMETQLRRRCGLCRT